MVMEPSGTRKWFLDLEKYGGASDPKIGPDGTVYFAGGDGKEQVKWTVPISGRGI